MKNLKIGFTLILFFLFAFISCTDSEETFDCTDCNYLTGKTISYLLDTDDLINDCTIVEDAILNSDFTIDIIRHTVEGVSTIENVCMYSINDNCILTFINIDSSKKWTNEEDCSFSGTVFSPVSYSQADNIRNLVNMSCETVLIRFDTFKIE